jgi:hypothetical protein
VTNARERWVVVRRRGLHVVANLAPEPRTVAVGAPVVEVVLASADVTVDSNTSLSLPSESVAIVRVAG